MVPLSHFNLVFEKGSYCPSRSKRFNPYDGEGVGQEGSDT